MNIIKALAILMATAGLASAQTDPTRAEKNMQTFDILLRTPVSILSYGILRLDETLNDLAQTEWYFKNYKHENEWGLLQAFATSVFDDNIFSPVIMIRATIYAPGSKSNRSKASAEELCQKLLEHISGTARIYLDEDNDYFSGLWTEYEVFPDYRKLVDHDSIQSLIYLKARVGYAGSDDLISCERFF